MFLEQISGEMFSEQVLVTHAFILQAPWNVLGTFEIGSHLGLRSMTLIAYVLRNEWKPEMIDGEL